MNYANLKKNDIANGSGIRVSLFVSGCRNACPNCFNKVAWDFSFGKPFSEETAREIEAALEPDYVSGLTILGGEPFEPENQEPLLSLTQRVKEKFKHKDIWCYTGFTLEELKDQNCRAKTEFTAPLLDNIDILVDGRFIESLKNISLQFRGSENQRIIDMNETRNRGEISIWKNLRK